MKLRTIAVWNKHGEVRRIDLTPGLNIITGASGTGKSALIDIVRYCLGSSVLNVPNGPITDTATYYGLLLEVGSTRAFAGRPAIGRQQASGTQAQLEIGLEDLPDAAALAPNTNRDALRTWIGQAIGIEENVWQPAEGQTRDPLVAKLHHALIHCFQRQDEIASRAHLFHEQAQEFMPAAIRDTLPYFLGVTGPEELRQAAELRRLKKQRAEHQRRRDEIDSIVATGATKAQRLLQQALDAGLAPATASAGTASEALRLLRDALEAEVPPAPEGAPAATFDRLHSHRRDLMAELDRLAERGKMVQAIARSGDDVEHESIEQIVRLQPLNLLPQPGEPDACPVCASPLPEPPQAVSDLQAALATLDERIADVERDRPALTALTDEIAEAEAQTKIALRENRQQLEALANADEAVGEYERRLAKGAWVRGRIDQYLETVDESVAVDVHDLNAEITRLAHAIEDLTETLDPGRIRDAATSVLANVGRPMTNKALRLNLEHAEHGARIDLGRLTVVVDDPAGPIYMSLGGIGSAKNWIGYHLAATLSLQEHFIRQERPVPRFLMLDQPTQAFFPSDQPTDEVDDQDRAEARAQFELLRDVAAASDDALQIIVLDHADFPDDWFQDAVREKWRDGTALIPTAWLSDDAPTLEEANPDSSRPG